MKMTIGVACLNRSEYLSKFLNHIMENTAEIFEIIIFDNGSKEDLQLVINECKSKMPDLNIKMMRVEKNIGVTPAYNRIWKEAKGDWVAFFHNDLYIYEKNWDKKIERALEENKNIRIGMMGFGGGSGMHANGARAGYASGSRDAACHGRVMTEDWCPAVVFDGYSIICKKEMLERIGGWYEDGGFRYAYDYDIALMNLTAGYVAMLVNVDCEHVCRVTYECPEVMKEHPYNEQIAIEVYTHFLNKWNGTIWMPCSIGKDWRMMRQKLDW